MTKSILKYIFAVVLVSAGIYALLPPASDESPPPAVINLPIPPSDERPAEVTNVPPAERKPAVTAETTPTTAQEPQGLDAAPAEPDTGLAVDPDETEDAADEPVVTAPGWIEREIRSGDTMAGLFQELELSPTLLARILAAGPEARRLADVRPGQRIRIRVTADGDIEELVHERSSVASLRIRPSGNSFEAVVDEKPVEVRNESATATINTSLFVDGQTAGLSDRVIMEVAELFNWDIDFARELRPGDRFSVIYEARFVEGEKYRDGDIIAAEFINNGKQYRAIRYRDPKGITDYYSPDGSSKKKAFIKTPVDFTRISSRFTKKRWHPILKRWRSHKGVDYAAPTGTPVKAAGKGKVTFVGRQRGYGKMIIVQHGDRYTTVYGHLSRFAKGLKKGSTVSQSETIGYVGQTGLATGPHLHYEFRVNGRHIDPLSHKLPTAMPLPKRYMADFKQHSEPLVEQLNLLGAPRLAEKD